MASQFPRVPVVWTFNEDDKGHRELSCYPHVSVDVTSLTGQRSVECLALIDTGAATSAVRRSVGEKFGRQRRPSMTVFSATGIEVVSRYEIGLRFKADPVSVECRWVVPAIDMPAGNGPHDLILGRDFLYYCRFTWEARKAMDHIEIGPLPERGPE